MEHVAELDTDLANAEVTRLLPDLLHSIWLELKSTNNPTTIAFAFTSKSFFHLFVGFSFAGVRILQEKLLLHVCGSRLL
jgi:hypothetical protein